MRCPKCGSKTRVITTCKDFSDHVRRYRRCPSCDHNFVTKQDFEQIYETPKNLKRNFVYEKEDILRMRRLYFEEGKSSREVAEIFGCTMNWVNKVVKRRAWANL